MVLNIDGTTIAAVIGAMTGSVATATMLWAWIGRPTRNLLKWVEEFRADWNGVPDRPGVPGRDGMMVRMAAVEGQLTTNGGSSLRDEIKRTEAAVAGIQASMSGATVIALPTATQPVAATFPSSGGNAA